MDDLQTESPPFYTARQPYASPPGYKSPALGDCAPIPGSQDNLNMGNNSISPIPLLARRPAAAEGNDPATMDNGSTPSLSTLNFESRNPPSQMILMMISPEESPSRHCPNHQSPPFKPGNWQTALLPYLMKQTIYPSDNNCHRMEFRNINHSTSCEIIVLTRTRKKGKGMLMTDEPDTEVNSPTHSSPIPLIAQIPAAFEGNSSAMMDDDSTSHVPTLVDHTAMTDIGSTPPITLTASKRSLKSYLSYACSSHMRNCQQQALESPLSLSSQMVIIPEKLPFRQHPITYTSPQLCKDEPAVNPVSQSATIPETSLARNLAALEGNHAIRLTIDSSSLTTLSEDETTDHQTTHVVPRPTLVQLHTPSKSGVTLRQNDNLSSLVAFTMTTPLSSLPNDMMIRSVRIHP
ncbi:uncharacterized protein LACBIDRAFT_328507 [Laccaria bicolor S238N-H82]|uniref:Predicted protein n=1 Tax=Laccaria bicolor (strain S238N-H82 / ATCC MYA-4686) TaxID=486041 RepID=B0DF24_LACBS|nr:uncharacterized protein LACBIDRAFT_328507 [Laccaria bicolor S238N-H82]EDR06774.1 predicted protein [Laccaria bicolor S238N-H82]|eukprot:XP_001882621.1 predicted protein [Laccaria bicolor S238N-H82]